MYGVELKSVSSLYIEELNNKNIKQLLLASPCSYWHDQEGLVVARTHNWDEVGSCKYGEIIPLNIRFQPERPPAMLSDL